MLKRTLFLAAILLTILGLALPSPALAQVSAPPTSSMIVKLIAGLTTEQQADVIARNGGTEVSTIPALRLHVIEVVADQIADTLARYQADPQVVRAEENKTRQAEAAPVDPLYSSQWALPMISWDLVFGTVMPTGSTTVAILDTGIDASHPDLAGNVIPGTSILDGSNGLTDPSGHGTWMAGIIAARTNTEGIAGIGYAGVRVMPVTVLDANGLGQDSDVIAGVIWAVEHGANVILMAFSNPGFSDNLQDAIDYAWANGVVLVAAVGNDAASTPTFPAGDRGVIGVSATDATDQFAAFSNDGQAVFLAAPGTDIETTNLGGTYGALSGTSASAAIVAGAAAMVKAIDPALTNGVIVGRLARTADPAGTQEQTGNGRINLARALEDTGMDFVEPAGADPVGSGGPFVGPYKAAGESVSASFTVASTTISASASSLTSNKTYQISYQAPGGSTTFHNCFTGVSSQIDSLVLSIPYTTGTWTVRLDVYNNNNSNCNNSGSGQGSRNSTTTTMVSVTSPNKLAITSVNGGSNPTFGTAFSVVVQSQNASSVATNVTANTAVTLSVNTGTGSLGGTISGTITTGSNSVTITGVTYSKAENGVVLTVTRTSGNALTAGNSASFNVLQASSTVTVTCPASVPYTGAAQTPCSAQATGVGMSPVDVTGSLSYSNNTNVGAATASASWGGDTNHTGNTGSGGFAITQASSTTIVSCPASVIYTGLAQTPCSATVTGAGGLSLTPTPSYTNNVSAGMATASYTYAGDPNHASSSDSKTFTIDQAPQTISFAALTDKHFGDADFGVSATGGASGQPVTFTAAGSCTMTGALVHITGVGSCTITAHQTGDTNYSAAPDVPQSFTITDNTPPNTSVDSGPTSPTNATTASFTFSGTDDVTAPASLTFECQLDSGGFSVCTSPKTYTSLADGSHTFDVHAKDAAGNVDASPATFNWSVDTAPPDTLLDSMPDSLTNQTTATFAFHATESSSTFECSLDGGAFTACTSPAAYSGLAEGPHTFAVQAKDAAGNVDPTPASFNWTVDTQAPDTLIDTHPANPTNSNTATFTFHGDLAGGDTFRCQLDAELAAACDSGTVTYSGLGAGSHTFTVTATDAAGNTDPSAASFTWTIDVTPPDTSITGGPTEGSTTTNTSATFDFTGTDNLTLPADLTFECSLDGAAFGPCTSPTSYSGLSRNAHTFAVHAKDAAGNTDASPASVTWTITKLTPVLTWANPGDITYPTALSGTQLNATADVAGSFTYTPASGTVLNAGNTQNLKVDFTPTDTTNYSAASKTVTINVLPASSTTIVSCPASVIYTGFAQTPCSASVTGAGGLNLTPTPTYANNTNVGTATASYTYAGDANHTGSSGSKTFTIAKATATCTVTGYAVPYDGSAHTATGSCTGVVGEGLSGLNLSGTTHTDAGTYPTDPWTFTDSTGNYNNTSGTVSDSIAQASSTTTVTCSPTSVIYTGAAQTPCSASVTGAGGLNLTPTPTYANNTNVGTATASYTYAGDANHTGSTDSKNFTITKADQTITFGALGDKTASDTPFTVSASASSGLPVSFSSNTSICTVSTVSGITTVTLTHTAGTCTLTASQGGDGNWNPAPDVSQSFTVNPGPAVTFYVVPSVTSTTAGLPFDLTVTAKDTYNNTATGYTGTAHFTSSDPHAALPSATAFAAGDLGVRSFTGGVTLDTAGDQTITATDGSITGTSAPITVDPANATLLIVDAPATAQAGVSFNVTVTAQDPYGNTATGYTGTVVFTSTDPKADSVADHTFTSGDHGSHPFTVTLHTAGSWTVTATDTANSLSRISHSITVAPGPAATLAFGTQPADTTVGATMTDFTVEVQDADGNLVPTSTASVAVAIGTNPSGGTLSGTLTQTASGGVATFSGLSLNKAGTGYTLVASSTSLTGATSKPFNVGKGTATLSLSNLSQTYDGSPKAVTVTTSPSGLSGVAVTYTGTGGTTYATSSTAPTSAGSYAVVASLSNPDYTAADATGTLVIGQASSTTTVSCPASVTYTGAAQTPCTVTVTGAGGLSLTPTPTYANNTNVGTATASYTYAGDANHTGSSGSKTFTIVKQTLTVTASPQSKQYSDPLPLLTVTYSGFVLGEGPGNLSGSLTCTTTATATSGPGTYPITCSGLTSGNYDFNYVPGTLTVHQEDARVSYTGASFASTSSATSSSATVTLAATIQDITASAGDPATDPYPGDIRNARVRFVNRDASNALLCDAPVGLVNSADTTVGTATCNWNVNITGDSQSFTVGIITYNYYTRDRSEDDGVITVSKPLNNFITGGGHLLLTSSAGLKAGDPGTKNNFGFNVKYNKQGTNLQGNINTIVRRTETDGFHVYQIKGNSMTSLAVQPCATTQPSLTCPAKATFNGKASIQDITNPLNPIAVDGNATLQVIMTDIGEPGNTDTIGITVWNKAGGLWFSSNWQSASPPRTVEQTLGSSPGGGNISVH